MMPGFGYKSDTRPIVWVEGQIWQTLAGRHFRVFEVVKGVAHLYFIDSECKRARLKTVFKQAQIPDSWIFVTVTQATL